jgi:hypothetical protein
MKARKFNTAGLVEFENYLNNLETDGTLPIPKDLLENPLYSLNSDVDIDLEFHKFNTRFQLAEYLYKKFSDIRVSRIEKDIELWAWCTLFYFDILCPPNTKGVRKPRERARYIPEPDNFQKYYRHYLAGPYLIYRAHKDDPMRAMALLCKPPHIHSEIQEQVAANGPLITNKVAVEVVTKLYYDSKATTVKKGASSKDNAPGTARRLVDILNQFDLTWDLYATTPDILIKMLPKEFGKFAKNNG